ncbi:hypothetical protein ACLIBG_07375 [Virgibacillus sp. W0181]|uniref:hypothetical protein n=1 Tax=Virgibacillus sp. W0181 TaxID=3391581 RepID=UPI003F46AC8D
MTDKEIHYDVVWGQKARVKLAEMKPFKIDPKLVFRNSKSIFFKPREKADDVVDDPESAITGYILTMLLSFMMYLKQKKRCSLMPVILS